MIDETITITSDDGANLFSVLNRSSTDDVLVIFVHGLTGDWYKTIPHVLARKLVDNDISCARLRLYPGGKGRYLLDTSITTHAQDVDTWVKYFSEKYSSIILVGHSLGCPAIYTGTSANLVAGVVYLEPSMGIHKQIDDSFDYIASLGVYAGKGGVQNLYSKQLVQEWVLLDGHQVCGIATPQMFIFGGLSQLYDVWDAQRINFPESISEVCLEQAGHGFSEHDTMDTMSEEVVSFIKGC